MKENERKRLQRLASVAVRMDFSFFGFLCCFVLLRVCHISFWLFVYLLKYILGGWRAGEMMDRWMDGGDEMNRLGKW